MVLRFLTRGDFSIPAPARWPGQWLAATVLALAVPWLGAAAPPLESGRSVDRMVVPARAPEGESPVGAGAMSERSSQKPTIEAGVTRVAEAAKPSTTITAVRPSDPVSRAMKAITACQERFQYVHDYTCTFVKRERVDGRLTAEHIMFMKARTDPKSVYFKFHQPNRGREAIYVQGRYRDRIVAHDVGVTKFLAGTMHLDPHGSMAMEDNRHPVTEAGIGTLIDTVAKHWAVELTPGESVLAFHDDARVGNRRCTMIESVHPRRGPNFLFHKVRLYIDQEFGLPIRFEAYDWPRHAGLVPDLVEEYSYLDLKLNVGLRDHDFDPGNQQYSFGRF
jgi:hypothetical protein